MSCASTLGRVDLSGLIFIALAIAWAVYLIPMALRSTDDLAKTRGVESFSSRLRVFGDRRATQDAAAAPSSSAASTGGPASTSARAAAPAPQAAQPAPVKVTMPPADRAAARRAAARRRRVLYVLTALLVIVGAVAGAGYAPYWSLAVPAALIFGFLAIARVTVKRERAARTIEVIRAESYDVTPAAEPAAPVQHVVPEPVVAEAVVVAESSTLPEDTVGISRAEVLHEDALPDDGSLWDPVPVTLPTYVSKPVARRTVRTIEFAQSSGHDAADSKLARDAEAARIAAQEKQAPEADATGDARAAGA